MKAPRSPKPPVKRSMAAAPSAATLREPSRGYEKDDIPWVPDRGDVVWLEFDPQAGREQAGRRPAVVLSPASYNAPTGRALCVPISSKAKGYPFEVAMPDNVAVHGVAFADQVKCLDWRARHASPAAALPATTLEAILARTRALLD